jgi:predicted RNase H-related nuclease YkuK (DUF458 family)
MSDFIEEIEIDILQNNVIKRNVAIDSLRTALKELKKGRKEVNHMAVDPCHVGTDSIVHDDYSCIIREIESLIKTMVGGDWCFSVNNTVEREEKIEDEIEDKEKHSDMKWTN